MCTEWAKSLIQGVTSMAEIATFGAGCFWGVEATFQRVPGVIDTAVGYSGGGQPEPTHQKHWTGGKGRAGGGEGGIWTGKRKYKGVVGHFFHGHEPPHT